MTQGGSRDYVDDVPYVRSFVRDLGPARLRLVAALNGFSQPPARDFDYCELGSGYGDTTAALAASYPRARFVGVDFNAEHIASARAFAERAGVSNVRFLERDFEDLGREALPDFDFIGAHGVLSWVGPTKRKALIDFASSRLKPGGLLYVGYNALPGWASIEPLRRLIVGQTGGSAQDSLERARQGLTFAKRLRDAGAAYFTNNPPAREMLATMERAGLPYIVHEYLNAHWTPMYFAQVAEQMAAGDLYFAGQLPLFLNYRDLAIPAGLAPLFQEVTDRITFETLKDYALDQYFRCDVFVKGRAPRSDATTQAYFEATPFAALLEDGAVARELRLPHYNLQFTGPLFDALVPVLAEEACTVGTLARRPELAAFGARPLRDAVLRLALAGLVAPMIEEAAPVVLAPTDALGTASAYNRTVLEQPLERSRPIVLASEVAGTGVPIAMLQAVALRLLTDVAPDDRPTWIRDLFQRQPFRLTIKDRPIDDADELVRVVMGEVARVRGERAGRLVALGILERR
jgi:SAM-dependent methyltransferase